MWVEMDDRTTPPSDVPTLTVAQLAQLAGVTVRTLHHYDRIGLLSPAARTDADYRLYGASEVERLREILVWRRLGVSLDEIRRLLDGERTDRVAMLRRQLEVTIAREGELQQLRRAIEQAIGDHEGASMQRDQEIIEALGGFDPTEHEAEAHARWADTDSYDESARRTSTYTAEDWRRIRAEADAITARLVALFQAGADPAGDEAVAQAEAFRAHVSSSYYACPPAMLRGLGDMYVADPRFRAVYDGADGERAGMAEWVRDAWHARADLA